MASKKILVSLGWFMATLCCIFGIVTKGVYASQHLRGENTDFLEEIPSTQSDREVSYCWLLATSTFATVSRAKYILLYPLDYFIL